MARVLSALVLLLLLSGWRTDDVPTAALNSAAIEEDCVPHPQMQPEPGRTTLIARAEPSPRRERGGRRVEAARTPEASASSTERARSESSSIEEGATPSRGRAIGALSRAACERTLREGNVRFERVPDATGVAQAIRLLGPVGGIRITPEEGIHAVLDCRLAAALRAWAPALRREGVAAIEHVSMYRPGARVAGTRQRSGHASGLAIDALAFVLQNGARLDVLTRWASRTHNADPCAGHDRDDDSTRRMRRAVCSAVERDLFQIVLTPHFDRAHANHVHLEVRPGVDWSYVH